MCVNVHIPDIPFSCIEIRESAKWAAPDFFWKNLVASSLSLEFLWQWDDALLGFEVAAAKTFAVARRTALRLFCRRAAAEILVIFLLQVLDFQTDSFNTVSHIEKDQKSLRKAEATLRYLGQSRMKLGWCWPCAKISILLLRFRRFDILMKIQFWHSQLFQLPIPFSWKTMKATKVACNVNALTFCSW